LTPSKGGAEAKAVIVEFSDFQCPFCARHATTVFPKLMEKFVDSGQARYLFANNPLSTHSNAKWLARLAMCAGEQGRFWEMHDRLFKFKPDSHDAAVALADDIPLNGSVLESCANEDNLAQDRIIERDQELAQRLRLVGTPGFAVGRVDNDGRVHVRKLIKGAMPVGVFDKVLAEFVKEPKGKARLVGRLNGAM
jgi:protein-disulfide isomerase